MSSLANCSHYFPTYRVQQTRQPSQPRYMVAKRLNGVRLNWFMFGMLFGMAACFMLNTGLTMTLPALDAEEASITQNASIALEEKTMKPANEALATSNSLTEQSLSALPGLDDFALEEDASVAFEHDSEESASSAFPKTITHILKRGETLADILTEQSISYQHAHKAIQGLKTELNPRDLRAGQSITLTLDQDIDETPVIREMKVHTSPLEYVALTRNHAGNFTARIQEKVLQPELTLAGGIITNSLFETGYANGIPDGILTQLMKAYSYDVDFQREIQRGDQVEVLFEQLHTQDGEVVSHGDIHYATLKLRGQPLSIYRFKDKDGDVGFYNEKGESVIKALLKTPVNGARISSGFGKRHHPILGYTKMHKGTDFAAATGTPIYAAGDATVTYAGRKGGYGNYIKLRHNSTYATAYAHLHRFAKGMRRGKKVKQGQVIGYVGTTGRSTGPHLHYEVHKNGQQVNPMAQKFDTGKVLKGTELANFKQSMNRIKQQVAAMPRQKTTLASAE